MHGCANKLWSVSSFFHLDVSRRNKFKNRKILLLMGYKSEFWKPFFPRANHVHWERLDRYLLASPCQPDGVQSSTPTRSFALILGPLCTHDGWKTAVSLLPPSPRLKWWYRSQMRLNHFDDEAVSDGAFFNILFQLMLSLLWCVLCYATLAYRVLCRRNKSGSSVWSQHSLSDCYPGCGWVLEGCICSLMAVFKWWNRKYMQLNLKLFFSVIFSSR